MEKKYELTEEVLKHYGHILHRIKAVIDFGNIKAGDLGGWIEKEDNLSHEGYCWVSGNAKVYGNAWVFQNASVCDEARVYGNAKVCDNARVCNNAVVFNYAIVCGYAEVYGHAEVYGYAYVHGNAIVRDKAKVYDFAVVYGNAEVCGDAVIKEPKDYAVFKNTWSSGRWFTWTRSNNMWKVGCFHGTGEALIAKAYKDSELSGKCYEAIVQAQNRISELLK